MLMSTAHFFKKEEAVFNPLLHFAPIITGLNSTIDEIVQEAGKVSQDITGATLDKSDRREKLEPLTHKVAAALISLCNFTGIEQLIEADDYLPSSLDGSRDSDVYVLARQLYIKANPVKDQLLPYNCTPADVDMLNTTAENFLPWIQVARNVQRERSRSVKKLAAFFKQADELLERADSHMAVYQYTNNDLFFLYKGARKIIDNASGHTVHKKSGRVLPGFVDTAPFAEGIVKPESKMIFTNSGKGGELFFYFSSKAGQRPAATTLLTKLANGKSVKTIASAAGYTVHTPVLNILNPNVRHGQWKAEVGK
jgi:hypothetical protein